MTRSPLVAPGQFAPAYVGVTRRFPMTTERSSEPTHVDPFAPREPRPDSPPPRDEPRNQETSVTLFPPRDRADRARDEAADTSDRQPDHTDPFAKKNRTAEETPPPPPSEASEPRDPD